MSLNSNHKASESSEGVNLGGPVNIQRLLTQWARQEADDKYVSDAYVKLGNDFRSATKAFSSNGIDISDIGNVPQALRVILEDALSEVPSQETLDRFLPGIRNIIVTLLQNLKTKQAKAKAISQEALAADLTPPTATMLQSGSNGSQASHDGNGNSLAKPDSDSKVNKSDALSRLQKGDVLQRRASKRFSAYQYAKLTNYSNNSNHSPMANTNKPQDSHNSNSANTTTNTTGSTSATTGSMEIPKVVNRSRVESNLGKDVVEREKEYLFLRIGGKTKKSPVSLPVTFASLRLLFVERFAYSPGSGNFPEIYIQDPTTGTLYELEEQSLDEVKTGTLLCLKDSDVENKSIQELNSRLNDLSSKLTTMCTSVISEVKDSLASINVAPNTTAASSPRSTNESRSVDDGTIERKDVVKLERDFRAVKQMHNSSSEYFKQEISGIAEQLKKFQETGLEVSQNSNRTYMDACNAKLSDDSDSLITKVDDLQDVMEELRKDVAQRGVRVSDKQLRHIFKDISAAKLALDNMSSYISKERPVWKKIWESELDKVCEEQQFLNLQDDLIQDLEEDIKKIEETYSLINQCSVEQTKGISSRRNKIVANLYVPEPGESLRDVKDAVLNDIAALTPNHEGRLEAIERAERIREKEREIMKLSKFQEELGEFVGDNRLKKSGGIAELEKQRQLKDSENLKSSFGII
ncbi:BUD6 Bud site selection protein 6 [Candida maltosa Xu316]